MSDGTYKPTITMLPNNIPPLFAFTPPPRPIGYWVLGAEGFQFTRFPMYVKPTDEQIKNTEALLGWKWEDAK